MLGGPGCAGAGPAAAGEDDALGCVEGHALSLQPGALLETFGANAALAIDHPLPRHLIASFGTHRTKGVADRAPIASTSDHLSHIAIGTHLAARDLFYRRVDALVEGEVFINMHCSSSN